MTLSANLSVACARLTDETKAIIDAMHDPKIPRIFSSPMKYWGLNLLICQVILEKNIPNHRSPLLIIPDPERNVALRFDGRLPAP
jgi:hypothetical protein